MLRTVLGAYGLEWEGLKIKPFGNGLINTTWRVSSDDEEYILQRVNDAVFKRPLDIAHNVARVAAHLQHHHSEYKFVSPINSLSGESIVFQEEEGYFRLFPFVVDSYCYEVAGTPEQAYETAKQFGRLTRLLSRMDVNELRITIPCFHDLDLRYQQFLSASKNGNRQRIMESEGLIKALVDHSNIAGKYKHIIADPGFKLRVTHHDTKIGNVLFDKNGTGICVIDHDTLMPGYFISDVGDMMRSCLSPVGEEERNVEAIQVRGEFYRAIVDGYFSEMKDELTVTEKGHFFYSGQFIIYMQALRFLTDHLNNDVYYGAEYEGQNFARANNQFVLLKRLIDKQKELS